MSDQVARPAPIEMPERTDVAIGCVGAGFIMADCHLVAYRNAGFHPVAISSRTESKAREVAARHEIPTVHDDWHALVADSRVEVLDVALGAFGRRRGGRQRPRRLFFFPARPFFGRGRRRRALGPAATAAPCY